MPQVIWLQGLQVGATVLYVAVINCLVLRPWYTSEADGVDRAVLTGLSVCVAMLLWLYGVGVGVRK